MLRGLPMRACFLISFSLIGLTSPMYAAHGAPGRHTALPTFKDRQPGTGKSDSNVRPHQISMHSNTEALGRFGFYRPDFSNLPAIGMMGMSLLGFLRSINPHILDNFRFANRKKNFLTSRNLRRSDPNISRRKRDLAYAKDLLDLLISVELELEKYGITEPQCQLRATCEMHRSGINEIKGKSFESFIRLISRMRSEIQNPRVVPLAKYVFEYYEEAAIRGENNRDCEALYDRCRHSLDYFMRQTVKKNTLRTITFQKIIQTA